MCKGISNWMKEDEEASSPPQPQEWKAETVDQVCTMLKSLHDLQQENKKLEGQIHLLNTAKEKLEHAH